MFGHQGPGVTSGRGLRKDLPETRKEIITVIIVPENLLPLNPPGNDMMKGSGRIDAGLSEHEGRLNPVRPNVNF